MLKNYPINFEQLIEENKDTIYRIASSYAQSPLEPKDLFQEVLYQIWKSLPSFEGKANIKTWVYRITLNVCMRSQMKLKKIDDLTIGIDSIQFTPADHAKTETETEKHLALQSCIAQLKKADQSVLILYLEDLNYKQISEIIGMTENHIAVKMKRIRKKLFDCITPKIK